MSYMLNNLRYESADFARRRADPINVLMRATLRRPTVICSTSRLRQGQKVNCRSDYVCAVGGLAGWRQLVNLARVDVLC